MMNFYFFGKFKHIKDKMEIIGLRSHITIIKYVLLLCAYALAISSVMGAQTARCTYQGDCIGFSASNERTSGTCEFTIDNQQTVAWRAILSGLSTNTNCWSDNFVIQKSVDSPGQQSTRVVLAADLRDTSNRADGEHVLQPGDYRFAWREWEMEPGTYTIWYDRVARLSFEPQQQDYGNVAPGESRTIPFKLKNTGETGDFPIEVTAISSSDPVHFVVSSNAATFIEPEADVSVDITCHMDRGTSGEQMIATITAEGLVQSTGEIVTTTANVQCARENVPDIVCRPQNLGTVDRCGGPTTMNYQYYNEGTANLQVTGASVVDSAGTGIFAVTAPIVATIGGPNGRGSIPLTFTPPTSGGTFCDQLQIQSNDPDSPIKNCRVCAATDTVPTLQIQWRTENGNTILGNAYSFGAVPTGELREATLVLTNIGDAGSRLEIGNVGTVTPPFSLGSPVDMPSCLGTPTLRKNESCEVVVGFLIDAQPTSVRILNTNLAITWGQDSNCSNVTTTTSLSAKVGPPVAQVWDSWRPYNDLLIPFKSGGHQPRPQPARRIHNCPSEEALITIKNIGVDPLTVGLPSWNVPPTNIEIRRDLCRNTQLSSGAMCNITVAWDPFSEDTHRCWKIAGYTRGNYASINEEESLTIPTNDERNPTLSITVTAPSSTCVRFEPVCSPPPNAPIPGEDLPPPERWVPKIPQIPGVPQIPGRPIPCPPWGCL